MVNVEINEKENGYEFPLLMKHREQGWIRLFENEGYSICLKRNGLTLDACMALDNNVNIDSYKPFHGEITLKNK